MKPHEQLRYYRRTLLLNDAGQLCLFTNQTHFSCLNPKIETLYEKGLKFKYRNVKSTLITLTMSLARVPRCLWVFPYIPQPFCVIIYVDINLVKEVCLYCISFPFCVFGAVLVGSLSSWFLNMRKPKTGVFQEHKLFSAITILRK